MTPEIARAAALACALVGKAPGCRLPAGPSRAVAALFVDRAHAAGVDPDLLLAVCAHESGFDQGMLGAAGEVGACQILPGGSAARGFSERKLHNLFVNVYLAARHLSRLNRFCGKELAIRRWIGSYSGSLGRRRPGEHCSVTRYGVRVENELRGARARVDEKEQEMAFDMNKTGIKAVLDVAERIRTAMNAVREYGFRVDMGEIDDQQNPAPTPNADGTWDFTVAGSGGSDDVDKPLTFAELDKIAEIFKTKRIDWTKEQRSSGYCDTCYDSWEAVVVAVKGATVP